VAQSFAQFLNKIILIDVQILLQSKYFEDIVRLFIQVCMQVRSIELTEKVVTFILSLIAAVNLIQGTLAAQSVMQHYESLI